MNLEDQEAIDGPMLISGDRIYFGTDSGRVSCASMQSDQSSIETSLSIKSAWNATCKGSIRGRPAITGTALAVLTPEEGIVFLDLAAGHRLSASKIGAGNGGGLLYDSEWLYASLGREVRAFGHG